MDRSLDSIGSCSLDVDADSSDISDTSGSLNFPTPISVKDITREFTANIRERCTLRSPLQPQPQRTITGTGIGATTTTTATAPASAYVNLDHRTGGLRMVLSPPAAAVVAAADELSLQHTPQQQQQQQQLNPGSLVVDAVEKKPSYLNLACCVNGYSNLTTYDSKIRQDINKSREVSPIRPSTSSLQYCKRNNSLAAPVLHSMPLTKQPATSARVTLIGEANKHSMNNISNNNNNSSSSSCNNNNNNNNNGLKNGHLENGHGDLAYCNGSGTTSSFIQQRVERLYGPGALAQGFYSPKKHSSSLSPVQRQHKQSQSQSSACSGDELTRKFKQLSPSKDYGEFRKKLHNNCTQRAQHTELASSAQNGDVDPPVFRHLSHEFRAQLPTVSPKRCVPRLSPAPEVLLPAMVNGNGNGSARQLELELEPLDVVDHEPLKIAASLSSPPERYNSTTKISAGAVAPAEKDGNYFLKILKDEQVRLLALAAVAEKYIDALTNNPDITEDTFGLLRSASGKARLLVSQKMKQFEGLCHNNLNRSPEDAFPTTIDDLQGFWDMVYLQVSHVDSIFADIEQLKANDWIVSRRRIKAAPATTTSATRTTKTGNPKTKTAGAAGGAAGAAKAAAASSAAALKREAQRKQLLEMKRQRREALAAAAKNQIVASDGNGDGAAAAAAAGEDVVVAA
ncbi:hypothetical protein KR222_005181, partial [Zaprionus bogoriensis]